MSHLGRSTQPSLLLNTLMTDGWSALLPPIAARDWKSYSDCSITVSQAGESPNKVRAIRTSPSLRTTSFQAYPWHRCVEVQGSNLVLLTTLFHSSAQFWDIFSGIFWEEIVLRTKKISCLYPFNVQGGKSQVEANLVEACLLDLLISADTEHSPAQELVGAFSV